MKNHVADNKFKYLRVLPIDGGEVRGIIPSRILQEIESRTNKHISDMMDAESDIDQTLASNMFKSNRYRLQVSLEDGMMAMDNSDPKNIQSLLQAAEKYISDNTKLIDEICGMLVNEENQNSLKTK